LLQSFTSLVTYRRFRRHRRGGRSTTEEGAETVGRLARSEPELGCGQVQLGKRVASHATSRTQPQRAHQSGGGGGRTQQHRQRHQGTPLWLCSFLSPYRFDMIVDILEVIETRSSTNQSRSSDDRQSLQIVKHRVVSLLDALHCGRFNWNWFSFLTLRFLYSSFDVVVGGRHALNAADWRRCQKQSITAQEATVRARGKSHFALNQPSRPFKSSLFTWPQAAEDETEESSGSSATPLNSTENAIEALKNNSDFRHVHQFMVETAILMGADRTRAEKEMLDTYLLELVLENVRRIVWTVQIEANRSLFLIVFSLSLSLSSCAIITDAIHFD
jgi:hypothetical protein